MECKCRVHSYRHKTDSESEIADSFFSLFLQHFTHRHSMCMYIYFVYIHILNGFSIATSAAAPDLTQIWGKGSEGPKTRIERRRAWKPRNVERFPKGAGIRAPAVWEWCPSGDDVRISTSSNPGFDPIQLEPRAANRRTLPSIA